MDRVLSAFLFLLVSLPTLHAAPQGATREDRTAIERLDAFAEGLAPDGLPSAVDLRPFLPEVGEQTMNDCAAWAFGYAGRSYLEAIDQGWKPNSDARIFSPTFIYNQVNGGVDQGSRVDHVLELLMEKGAATLQTAPYLAKDYLTPPPSASFEEAKVFPIADFGALPDGTWIRQALGEGHIVLACVRTNPIFSGGHARPYTREDHARGQAARRPDQPHGFHAMAIVGYSDAREAFLFMNSWGKQWGEDGFLWVSYDVLDKFNTDQDTTQLMDFAIVMLDRREPVQRNGGSYEVVTLDSLEPHLFATYAGQEGESGADAYRFSLALRGARETMQYVTKVVWQVPGLDGPREVTSQERAADFRLTGLAPDPSVQVRGTAHLQNGSTVELQASTVVPESWKRDIGLRRIDAFHAAWENGTNTWRWTMMPQLSDTDWQELESIRWSLEGLPDSEAKVYTHAGGLPPEWTMESLAQPSFHTSEPQRVIGEFRFRDGAVVQRTFDAEPFTAEVLKGPKMDYVARPEGNDGGRGWHFLELQVRYQERWKDEILGVRMGTGTDATWREAAARQVGGPEPYRHVYGTYVDGGFWPTAMLFFRSPMPGLGRSTPASSPGEIDLGVAAAWHDPWPEGGNLDAVGRGFGLNYRDRFLGMVDGQPRWSTEVFLDGNANLSIVKEMEWEFEEHAVLDAVAQAGIPEWDAYRWRCLQTSKPFRAKAKCVDYNGFAFELTLDVVPRSSANTGLAVDMTIIPVPELEAATPQQVLAGIDLIGTTADLKGLRSLRAWPRRSWGGILEVPVIHWAYDEPPADDFARLEVAAAEPTLWFLEFDDGSGVTLSSLPHAAAPVPTAPPAQVLARERFLGWQAGKPVWEVEVGLRGDRDRLEAVTSVAWKVRCEDGATIDTESHRDRHGFRFRTSSPAAITADLGFGSGETLALEGLVAALSERLPREFEVRAEAAHVPDLMDPFAPEMVAGDSSQDYRVRVVATPETMASVEKVTYYRISKWRVEVAEERGEEASEGTLTEVVRTDDGDPFFPYTFTCYEEDGQYVTPTLHFKDGTTRKMDRILLGDGEDELHEPERTLVSLKVQDWGEVDGQRATLLRLSLPPSTWTQDLLRALPIFDKEIVAAGGSPLASFDHPHSLREYLITEPTTAKGLEILKRDRGGAGFRLKEVELPWPAQKPKPAGLPPVPFVWTEREEGQEIHYLYVAGPTSEMAAVERVSYEFRQAGERKVYLPVSRMGERNTNFEVRLYGSRPTGITVRLFGKDGFLKEIRN